MAHSKAKLTPLGRQLLVQRVECLGWPAAQAAEAVGVSRSTAYKWVERFRKEGMEGLEDRSSRPGRCPQQLSRTQELRILVARQRLKAGPHRLSHELGCPRSTIYAVLRRNGFSRLCDADRPSGAPVRYVRERPGELLHLDVKKLGRIPEGGGHRVLGREEGMKKKHRMGNEFVHVAVDDASRVAYVQILPNERGDTCAHFLLAAAGFFAGQGVRIERVLTDRAWAYRASRAFPEAVDAIGAQHKLTRPYSPQTNGKAERFIQTMLREWAYARVYRTNSERLEALPEWVEFYNHRRPHMALGGRPPITAVVNNVRGNDS